ncbi:MAG: MAPEG family protein [Pikeienuella sp.]
MTAKDQRIRKFTLIITGYPVALIAVALAINYFAFGIQPLHVALPSNEVVTALVVAAISLLLNHTWLMTTTELTRLNYDMHASHEEWKEAGARKEDVPKRGWVELERRHNAHRNATENTVYFGLLALTISIASPSILAAQVWIIGFAVSRLGYTYSALRGRSGLRGIFMSVSLLSLYGLAGYLGLALII